VDNYYNRYSTSRKTVLVLAHALQCIDAAIHNNACLCVYPTRHPKTRNNKGHTNNLLTRALLGDCNVLGCTTTYDCLHTRMLTYLLWWNGTCAKLYKLALLAYLLTYSLARSLLACCLFTYTLTCLLTSLCTHLPSRILRGAW
jgi:hypothetical protein